VSLLSIGSIHFFEERYDKALDSYQKSLNICLKIGAQRPATYNYCGLAETYLKRGDFKRALEFCNSAFNLSNKIGVVENIAQSRRIYGMIYREQKKWNESIKNFEESIRIFKDIGMERELGNPYYEFGLMWKEKGNSEKAKEYLNKALDTFEKLKAIKSIEKVESTLKDIKT
jgi:tetratricopeptide (TPR) repeat protein